MFTVPHARGRGRCVTASSTLVASICFDVSKVIHTAVAARLKGHGRTWLRNSVGHNVNIPFLMSEEKRQKDKKKKLIHASARLDSVSTAMWLQR